MWSYLSLLTPGLVFKIPGDALRRQEFLFSETYILLRIPTTLKRLSLFQGLAELQFRVYPERSSMGYRQITFLMVALVLIGLTGACQPIRASPTPLTDEVEVSFDTLALDEEGLVPLVSEDPLLLMITSSAEIPAIADRISYDNLEKLKTVDFQHYIVIALFRDMQLSTGYPTYIKRIVQRNQQWVVYAEFWAPPAISHQGMAITATYHLVKVAKQEQTSEDTELVLETKLITPTPPAR